MKKTILFLLLLFVISAYSNETVVKLKVPGFDAVNVLKATPSGLVYAGTWGDGVYISANSGTSFTEKNNGLSNLFINDIVFDSQENVYLATQGDGIFVTKNNGNLWTKLPFDINLNVTSVYISPFDDNTIYAGTYGSGLFVSTDAGTTWNSINRSEVKDGVNIAIESMHITAIAQTVDSTLLAGTYGDGVYRSEDGGKNWRRANSGTGGTEFINQIDVISKTIILMATNDKGLLESNNDALQWVKYEAGADSLKDSSINCFEYTSQGAVVGSREHGIWFYEPLPTTDWVASDKEYFGITDITELGDGTLLAYDLESGLMKSTNKGRNWEPLSLPIVENKSFLTSAANDFIINVNDKMYISSDVGTTWSELTSYEGGMVNHLIYSQGKLLALKDHKVLYSTNKGTTWSSFSFGGPLDYIDNIAIAPNGDMYMTFMYNFYSTTDGDTLRNEVYKSTDNGVNWVNIRTLDGFTKKGSLVAVDANNNLYYHPSLGTTTNELLKSTNGGTSFVSTGYTTNVEITDIQTGNGNVYLTTQAGLMVSEDNGTSFSKIEIEIARRPFGHFQPELNADLAISSSSELFIGLSKNWGVYHTTNGGVEWDSIHSGYIAGEIYGIGLNGDRDLLFSGHLAYKYLNGNRMGVPQLASPTNGALNQQLDLSFDWSEAGKADLYNFQISANKNFTFSYENIITSSTDYDIFYNLKPNTKYYWRVRGKTGGVYSNWSTVFDFTTLIGPPTLMEPVKDTISVSHTPTFLWHSVEDAEKYKLFVATDESMTNIILTKTGLIDTSYTLTNDEKLNPLTVYYWAAVVEGADGSQGQLSEIWKFRTVLAAPILTSPANNAANQANEQIFEWLAVEEGVDYQIQISRIADFNQNIFALDAQTLGALQQSLSELETNANYYWRVRATDTNKVKGPWSEIWSFKTGQERPTHISPANNSGGHQAQLLLDWSEVNSYKYDLQVSLKPEFTGPFVVDQSSIPDHRYELASVETNKTYYWRVRAVLNDTVSPWTEPWNFSTGLARTVLLSPEDNSIDVKKLSVLFKWEPTPGADSYKLQVSRNESFTDFFYNDSNITTSSKDVYDLDYEAKYYWRVMAFDGETGNDWSEEWSFTTEEDPVMSVVPASELGISVFPNPTSEIVTVNIPTELVQNISKAKLISQTGQELRVFDINSPSQIISLADLTNGTYYLILEGKEDKYMFKLNKVK